MGFKLPLEYNMKALEMCFKGLAKAFVEVFEGLLKSAFKWPSKYVLEGLLEAFKVPFYGPLRNRFKRFSPPFRLGLLDFFLEIRPTLLHFFSFLPFPLTDENDRRRTDE